MQDKNNKLHKAAKGASIAVKAVLVLCGIAITAFFAWIGYTLYTTLVGMI